MRAKGPWRSILNQSSAFLARAIFSQSRTWWTALSARPPTKRNTVKALSYDNAYATSIVLLLIASVESYATRLRYVRGPALNGKKYTVPNYIKHVFPDFLFVKALIEVFVLRDAIFHNHLWEVQFTSQPMSLISANQIRIARLDTVDVTQQDHV
jgi:hypothetical protein